VCKHHTGTNVKRVVISHDVAAKLFGKVEKFYNSSYVGDKRYIHCKEKNNGSVLRMSVRANLKGPLVVVNVKSVHAMNLIPCFLSLVNGANKTLRMYTIEVLVKTMEGRNKPRRHWYCSHWL
jgi:hypothetical protein